MSDIEYNKLVPASKKSMYVSHILVSLIALAIALVCGFFIPADFNWVKYVVFACAALIIAYAMISPIIYYNYYRYALTDDRIDVRHGVIIRTHEVVPIERIHQVEVVHGPINRMFNLANVQVTTAGGVSSIKFLETEVAESIVDDLNEVINKILKGRSANV